MQWHSWAVLVYSVRGFVDLAFYSCLIWILLSVAKTFRKQLGHFVGAGASYPWTWNGLFHTWLMEVHLFHGWFRLIVVGVLVDDLSLSSWSMFHLLLCTPLKRFLNICFELKLLFIMFFFFIFVGEYKCSLIEIYSMFTSSALFCLQFLFQMKKGHLLNFLNILSCFLYSRQICSTWNRFRQILILQNLLRSIRFKRLQRFGTRWILSYAHGCICLDRRFVIAASIIVRKPIVVVNIESVYWGLHSFTFWWHCHV